MYPINPIGWVYPGMFIPGAIEECFTYQQAIAYLDAQNKALTARVAALEAKLA